MNKMFFFILSFMISAFSSYSQKEVFLWEDSVKINNPSDFPHENYKEERYIYTKNNTLCIRKVTNPTLTIFLADSSINTGAAVIICPGGGMNTIVFEHEGTIIAEEFVKLGINAFVLKYRHYNRNVAISDIKQAISYVRENAMSMGINDKAIGIGGFSAGGRMSLETTYQLINMDTTQCNIGIDFLMFVYTRTQIIENAVVNKCFPPSFMLVTADDFRYKMNLEFAEILDNNKIPFELHVFQKGLHGFGLGKGLCNCDIWPQLFYQWLSNNNFINTKG